MILRAGEALRRRVIGANGGGRSHMAVNG